MTHRAGSSGGDESIRMLLDVWTQAVRDKDIERLISCHSSDLIAFDAWGPLWIDAAIHRDHWEQCFAGHDGPIHFELRDVQVTAGQAVAFCSFLLGMSGTLTDGTWHSFWGRGTLCMEHRDGRWLVTHVHASAPFDPLTGTACIDLAP